MNTAPSRGEGHTKQLAQMLAEHEHRLIDATGLLRVDRRDGSGKRGDAGDGAMAHTDSSSDRMAEAFLIITSTR